MLGDQTSVPNAVPSSPNWPKQSKVVWIAQSGPKILSFNIALKNLRAIFLGHLVFVCRLACQNAWFKVHTSVIQTCIIVLVFLAIIAWMFYWSFFSSHLYVWKPTVRRTRVMWGGAIENHETNLSWSTVTRQPRSAYIFKNFCCLHNSFYKRSYIDEPLIL